MLVFRGEPLETNPRLCLEKMVLAGRNHSSIPGDGGKLASTVATVPVRQEWKRTPKVL